MILVRQEVRAALWRWREVIGAGFAAGFGLWLIWLGGLVLVPLGGLVMAVAAAAALFGWRKLRFGQGGGAPGVVEVLEGQVSYFGPAFGGSLSLPDLVELRLLTAGGRRLWRLRDSQGQVLLIPVDAVGADRLFEAFAALPGMRTQALVQALAPQTPARGETARAPALPDSRVIWRHPGRAVLT